MQPGVKPSWDDCDVLTKAKMIGYSQIRELEEHESHLNLMKALFS